MPSKKPKDQYHFGIGEWFGRSFAPLTPAERKTFANLSLDRGKKAYPSCPFQSTKEKYIQCTKKGGNCSLRRYVKWAASNVVEQASDLNGRLRTVCPYRFEEDSMIYGWVGEILLNCPDPIILKQIGFLESLTNVARNVGRIDTVLVVPDFSPLSWCALEVQAVYFQGDGMGQEFAAIRDQAGPTLPFPVGSRRPDYRSSGPKRLMPQLQVKVPTLRTWGKKMAVVVDQDFFDGLGPMESVDDVSNCEIAWFIVKYDESKGAAKLARHRVHLTTLDATVKGLTAGKAISLPEFEKRIQEKLNPPETKTRKKKLPPTASDQT